MMKKEKKIWNNAMKIIDRGEVKLGKYFSYQILNNTRHLVFALSRYKFAAKMLIKEQRLNVLELGCSEGIGTLILADEAKKVTAIDFYEKSILWAKKSIKNRNITFKADDFLGKRYGIYGAVVSIDVIEHISPKKTDIFMKTIVNNLTKSGICIVGTPNKSANKYASPESKKAHVNMFSAKRLRRTFLNYFENVFLFGMNDEVLHTGFEPMCQYLFVVACNPKVEKK